MTARYWRGSFRIHLRGGHLRVQEARVRVRQALGQHLPHRAVRGGPVPQRLCQRLVPELHTQEFPQAGMQGGTGPPHSLLTDVSYMTISCCTASNPSAHLHAHNPFGRTDRNASVFRCGGAPMTFLRQ